LHTPTSLFLPTNSDPYQDHPALPLRLHLGARSLADIDRLGYFEHTFLVWGGKDQRGSSEIDGNSGVFRDGELVEDFERGDGIGFGVEHGDALLGCVAAGFAGKSCAVDLSGARVVGHVDGGVDSRLEEAVRGMLCYREM
jgi:hypothetical protein